VASSVVITYIIICHAICYPVAFSISMVFMGDLDPWQIPKDKVNLLRDVVLAQDAKCSMDSEEN